MFWDVLPGIVMLCGRGRVALVVQQLQWLA